MNKDSENFHPITESLFIDLYDFLGIPPVSPPNLIYLALLKIESYYNKISEKTPVDTLLQNINRAREELLNTSLRREHYEKTWEDYYFPKENNFTNIEKLCLRNTQSRFLGLKFRTKDESNYGSEPNFNYSTDFSYFVMRDLPTERDVFYLDPNKKIHLSPLQDTIFFKKSQFYLQSHGKIQVSITNDSLGKNIVAKEKFSKLPLHIGDRIEFESGARLILRGLYTSEYGGQKNSSEDLDMGFYCQRENVVIPLDPKRIYIFGRNTSDIQNLAFDEDIFCFVNIGRRERSISRQNFQVFCHDNFWYIQDLGSRYGTTLDFEDHFRFETLAGGSIMPLEHGRIRLGYDKSYVIEINSVAKLQEKKEQTARVKQHEKPETSNHVSFYNIPLL